MVFEAAPVCIFMYTVGQLRHVKADIWGHESIDSGLKLNSEFPLSSEKYLAEIALFTAQQQTSDRVAGEK